MLYEVITHAQVGQGRAGEAAQAARAVPEVATERNEHPSRQRNRHGHLDGERADEQHRITSYNVCYTKLLRIGAHLPQSLAEYVDAIRHRLTLVVERVDTRTTFAELPMQLGQMGLGLLHSLIV